MITSNVINRVFHLKYGQGTGTCFTIDYENKQYIVTAKHVVEGLKTHDTVKIYFEDKWVDVPVKIVGHHTSADVSVFSVGYQLSTLKLEPTSDGVIYGQDTYFLGFPYMLQDNKSGQINRNFPMPLVKKATLSCMTYDHSGRYVLLDGINNPGFSGGPVVFTEPNKSEFKVMAIISGYRYSEEPTYQDNLQTSILVRSNTGIIVAYEISNAIDIIKGNPIGFPLSK